MTKKRKGGMNGAAAAIAEADAPQIPELADEKDDELIRLAKRYNSNMKKLKDASSDLQSSQDALKEAMHKRGITRYRYGKLEIDLAVTEKAKVREKDDEADNEE